MTALCSQRLTSLRRSDPTSSEDGEFWRRGAVDNALLRPISIPEHLRVPSSKWNPNLYFLNMIAHSSIIRVRQEALAKISVDSLQPEFLKECETVCLESAIEIAGIMRASCHIDLSAVSVSCTSICYHTNVVRLTDKPVYFILLVCRRYSACSNKNRPAR